MSAKDDRADVIDVASTRKVESKRPSAAPISSTQEADQGSMQENDTLHDSEISDVPAGGRRHGHLLFASNGP